MNDALSTSEIKKRSLTGAKWLILTNGFGMPAAFLIALILGRTGPAALGAYALAQIFIGVIVTFAVFGGPAVLRNFMPKVSSAEERGRFLFSYGLILAGFMSAILILFYFFPSLLEFLMQREFRQENYGWFVLLTIVVVSSVCLMGAASGLMHIKLAAIARLMVRIVILPLLVGLFFLNRSFLLEHTTETILVGFLAAYAVGAILCAIGIWRDPRFQLRIGWRLPPGFGSFAFTSYLSLIFSFFYLNFDRMCVLSLSDIEGLGMYQAVISLALLIDYLPNILQHAFVPTFSSLLASNKVDDYHKAFSFIYRNAVILMTVLALLMMGFSREFLTIFGETYGDYDYLLCLFCFANIVRSPAFASMAVLTSMEKNTLRLVMSTIQIVIQVSGTLFFIAEHGVLAIAGSKLIAVIIASTIGHFYVIYRLRMAPRLPRSFKAAIATGLVALVLRSAILPEVWWVSFLFTCGAISTFAVLARVTSGEVWNVASALVTQKRDFLGSLKNGDDNND